MNSKRKIKILYLADSEEQESTKRVYTDWVTGQLGVKDLDLTFIALSENFQGTVQQLEDLIAGSDAIIFDYGGLSMSGGSYEHMIDHWNRFFIRKIEEFPSKRWFCVSAIKMFCPEEDDHLKELGVTFRWDH